jgi:hypothetical protein
MRTVSEVEAGRHTAVRGLGRAFGTAGAFIGIILAFYSLSVPMVFDLSRPASILDEDNTPEGCPVAAGPRPRRPVCYPSYYDCAFTGREWPFQVYSPVCWAWRKAFGYAPPTRS